MPPGSDGGRSSCSPSAARVRCETTRAARPQEGDIRFGEKPVRGASARNGRRVRRRRSLDATRFSTAARSAADVRFAITDDGASFEAHGASQGVGLVNMRDRIGAVSGELEINSRRATARP